MAPTKTSAPPKKTAPAPKKSSRPKYLPILGAIVVIGLIVWLVAGVSSSPGSTTTTTTTAAQTLSYKQQITTSLADTQQIFSKFKRLSTACTSDVCVENVAANALMAEGITANLVHQNFFPSTADAGGYVKLLISFQESYKGLSEGATRADLPKDIADLDGGMAKTVTSAQQVLAAL